eukprot:s39_g14.t1
MSREWCCWSWVRRPAGAHYPAKEIACVLPYLLQMFGFYGLGAIFYVSRWPECRWPGYFDIIGHSHQRGSRIHGRVAENQHRARCILERHRADLKGLHLLVLPEMAFTGYFWKSKETRSYHHILEILDRTVGEIYGLLATEAFPAPAPVPDPGAAPATAGAPPAGAQAPPELAGGVPPTSAPGSGDLASASWIAISEARLEREGKYHLKGRYLGCEVEVTGRIEALIEDSLGKWGQFTLFGTNSEVLREWRLKETELFYVSQNLVASDKEILNPELFYTQKVKSISGEVGWGKNLMKKAEDQEGPHLEGIENLARELGYGAGQKGNQVPEGAAGAPEPSAPARRKLKGKERVAQMMKSSHWSWKGSSLDPKFKRPKIRLKRKRDESTSSSGSHSSQRSDDQDLFPEEDQIKYIHRKCPGLLTRHAIKQGKEKVLFLQGESNASKDPEPVFVRYHRQVFLQNQPSAPLKREHLTLSSVLDALVRGEVLKAADIACQRLKSLEQISQGASPQLAIKLEILPQDRSTLASSEEAKTAASEHQRDLKLAATWKGTGKTTFSPSSWQVEAPKGSKAWKGNAKGNQKGSKGEKSGKTQVVAPS